MAYRALYREWRPKDFSHVVGQNAIIDTLRNQVVNRRIAHAYLFCGSRGTGKTSTAKILAKAINCSDPVNGDPCGKCENCLRAENEETLDVIEIDAASNNGVDEMRELRETVKYPPQFGNYKVYIIDEVHMLSTSAFNALLKTLEEPPAHVVFILATTEPQKLPETILSRCQRFDFGRIPLGGITGRLREAAEGAGAQVSDGALMTIARAAEGGMRDALSILDMCLGYSDRVDETLVRNILGTSDAGFLFEFCGTLGNRDAGKAFGMIDRLIRDGKDPAVFARDVSRHIRTLLFARTGPEEFAKALDLTEEEAAEYIRQANEYTVSRMMKVLDVFMGLDTEMRYSASPRLALENAAMKCCLRLDEADQQALLDRIEELEQKIGELNARLERGSAAAPAQPGNTSGAPATPREAVKTEKPKPAPVKAAAADADEQGVWNTMLSRLQKADITAWSFLTLGRLISGKDGRYIWQANSADGEAQYISSLNRPERRDAISALLTEIAGGSCTFQAAAHTAAPADDGSDEAYLNSIYETFGREPVDVVDRI